MRRPLGGIATYQKNLAEECVRQGHRVYVICRSLTRDSSYIENGVNVIRLYVEDDIEQIDFYKKYRYKVAEKLFELQSENLIDIIEVPDWGGETVFFESRRKIPLVVRLHTPLEVWLKYNKNNFGPITELLLEWEEKMLKSADYITCCSMALKNIIVKDFNISEERIKVTPNPANLVSFYRDCSIKKENVLLYVGSLEERKGVIVLAEALNRVLKDFPDLCVKFIGKDTNRNNKNISTVQYIRDIINDEYANNVEFTGQLPNENLNYYFNSSKLAVFPSLFDNFPYVVLEAMATGINIVGSRNSGMVEMLNDETAIYDTGNSIDLARVIVEKLHETQKIDVVEKYIDRVKEKYNAFNVCKDLIKMYSSIIETYNAEVTKLYNIENILKKMNKDLNSISVMREKGGVANFVFRVKGDKNEEYIVKKYNNNVDFELSEALYDIYNKYKINVIRPINSEPIECDGFMYNVFQYVEHSSYNYQNDDIEFFSKLVMIPRNTEREETILKKCLKYYNFIKKCDDFKEIDESNIKIVEKCFETLKDNTLFKEQYINHGDISRDNILCKNSEKYIIDFDEVNVTTMLYDFAVIVVKMFMKDSNIDIDKYQNLKTTVKKEYSRYTDDDFIDSVRFYLCKILLEKFFLHINSKIDLFSKRQMGDCYKRYLNMLNQIEREKLYGKE